MAKRKKAQPWDAVFSRVRVVRFPNVIYPAPTTDVQLDEMEAQVGSRLPSSYREFMKQFGPGCFEELEYLLPILPLGKGRAARTLATQTAELRKVFGKPGRCHNHAWLFRLVYFASNVNGNAEYAWDPEDVTSATSHEYRFFRLWRLEEDEPELVGDSFAGVVSRLETDVRLWLEREPDDNPLGITFRPAFLRNKKVPPKRDVKLWLAFNNNTARDLALSIRDHGRTDAFPILADALQEAGCTNTDLLDSCRTGDPDIDGAWVLQVLLGKS